MQKQVRMQTGVNIRKIRLVSDAVDELKSTNLLPVKGIYLQPPRVNASLKICCRTVRTLPLPLTEAIQTYLEILSRNGL